MDFLRNSPRTETPVMLFLYTAVLIGKMCVAQDQLPAQQPVHSAPPVQTSFQDTKEIHNEEHIKQHLSDQINVDTSKMTEEQLQFHYFNMYDTDKNGQLDGIELIKAITHFHGDDPNHPPPKIAEPELESMVDNILRDDDFNNDGFIDYTEFVKSQSKTA